MLSRREFLSGSAAVAFSRLIPLRTGPNWPDRTVKLAVLADLHHGLAPDALSRFEAFVAGVRARHEHDAVLQMGDFCYSDPGAKRCLDLWRSIRGRRLGVLGNHDMDKCDKATATFAFGMPGRYYSQVIGGYRFVVLDLNHFKKYGKLNSYANGNYFADGASCNWADPEQLVWLDKEVRASREPVILISHQPLGFAELGQAVPPEQREVLDVIAAAGKANPAGAVALSMFGHLHVDRLEHVDETPFYCVNSASYFWFNGMHPYTAPLFAFMELQPDGHLKVQGVQGEFVRSPPTASASVLGRSASIQDRSIGFAPGH